MTVVGIPADRGGRVRQGPQRSHAHGRSIFSDWATRPLDDPYRSAGLPRERGAASGELSVMGRGGVRAPQRLIRAVGRTSRETAALPLSARGLRAVRWAVVDLARRSQGGRRVLSGGRALRRQSSDVSNCRASLPLHKRRPLFARQPRFDEKAHSSPELRLSPFGRPRPASCSARRRPPSAPIRPPRERGHQNSRLAST